MSEQNHMMTQHGHPGKLVRIGIVVLIGALLLGLVVSSVQQAAWSQGYALGLIAGGGQGDTLSQYLLYNNGALGNSGPGFGGVPLHRPADLRLLRPDAHGTHGHVAQPGRTRWSRR